MVYDKIIIGAGLYGVYAALRCGKKGEKICLIESEKAPFTRATYINQARVHMGYHYPRSFSTAIKSAHYFERFNEDYGFCIHNKFTKVYGISSKFSWTNGKQFEKFCKDANILCEAISNEKYFKPNMCDGSYITEEYTYDAQILKEFFMEELSKLSNVSIYFNSCINKILKKQSCYSIYLNNGEVLESDFVLNATYASINQLITLADFEPFKIKYELCEIILCKANDELKDIGVTVMDGPFFSIMPFGKTGYHSLTSVTFTPHMTSYDSVPRFDCQIKSNGFCTPQRLGNCNECKARPNTSWDYMKSLAQKYMNDKYNFVYFKSLFSMKPILMASEIDDSRPTVVKVHSKDPMFVSVLSGKINTVYDLDEVLSI